MKNEATIINASRYRRIQARAKWPCREECLGVARLELELLTDHRDKVNALERSRVRLTGHNGTFLVTCASIGDFINMQQVQLASRPGANHSKTRI